MSTDWKESALASALERIAALFGAPGSLEHEQALKTYRILLEPEVESLGQIAPDIGQAAFESRVRDAVESIKAIPQPQRRSELNVETLWAELVVVDRFVAPLARAMVSGQAPSADQLASVRQSVRRLTRISDALRGAPSQVQARFAELLSEVRMECEFLQGKTALRSLRLRRYEESLAAGKPGR